MASYLGFLLSQLLHLWLLLEPPRPLTYQALTTYGVFLFLKLVTLISVSGLLHLQFPLPGTPLLAEHPRSPSESTCRLLQKLMLATISSLIPNTGLRTHPNSPFNIILDCLHSGCRASPSHLVCPHPHVISHLPCALSFTRFHHRP